MGIYLKSKATRQSSAQNYQVEFKYDYVFLTKKAIYHTNITKHFKIRCNIVQLCSLYVIPYDLQWLLCYRTIKLL